MDWVGDPVWLGVAGVVGLVAGTLALLHDKAGGSQLEIPLDLLPRIARGADCIDNEQWWEVGKSLQGAAWATIAGSGPEGTDPWDVLWQAAEQGESSGVRVGWAIHNLIAANGGQDERLQKGLARHANSLEQNEQNQDWALLDEYSRRTSLHQSDLIWISEVGHRSPKLGDVPPPPLPPPSEDAEDDPFGGEEDPFGAEE